MKNLTPGVPNFSNFSRVKKLCALVVELHAKRLHFSSAVLK